MTQRSMRQYVRAFTIVEMLVTIGILVVVAVGVATIFSSVGETVANGRKISELNQFAARIERVMREDFEQMTRDGFLVIVNKNANFGDDVRLYRGDQNDPDLDGNDGRSRRSDEIMFFARGDFESARRAIASNMRATSSEAAIYYGHGQKRRPMIGSGDPPYNSTTNFFFNPQPWDDNFDSSLDTRLGVETLGQVNPNEFARDWSLIRQVTLLSNPAGTGQQVPQEIFGFTSDNPVERPFLQDSPRQISLQPAARSIFSALSRSDTTAASTIPLSLYDLSGFGSPRQPALRESGVIDIASEDLATIRNIVQAVSVTRPAGAYTGSNRDLFETEFYNPIVSPSPSDALSLDLGRYGVSGNWVGGNAGHISRVRSWMIDALPSRWVSTATPQFIGGVRYEDIPTRIMYTDDDFSSFGSMEQRAMARAYAEANQEMLGSSVFVPRCTEFVVEWSYGFVDNSITDPSNPQFKELIWYGLDRVVDSNNDGVLDANDRFAARTYRPRAPAGAGTDPTTTPASNRLRGPSAELVVGHPPIAGFASPAAVEIATFGFATKPGDGQAGAYWPWPKLIRITMSLGDPTDRDVEKTYQVIFRVPELE